MLTSVDLTLSQTRVIIKVYNIHSLLLPGLYDRTLALKKRNPDLKVLLAVGGWAVGSAPFVPMVSSSKRR